MTLRELLKRINDRNYIKIVNTSAYGNACDVFNGRCEDYIDGLKGVYNDFSVNEIIVVNNTIIIKIARNGGKYANKGTKR